MAPKPAFAKATSIRPIFLQRALCERLLVGPLGDVAANGNRALGPAQLLRERGQLVLRSRSQDQPVARCGRMAGGGLADAARGAGDHEDGIAHGVLSSAVLLTDHESQPDQVSSIAQTLLSTRPFGRATSRMAFSSRSVGTPDARFGHATHRPAGGVDGAGQTRRAGARARHAVVKKTTTSKEPRACVRAPLPAAARRACVRSRPGAPRTASRLPSLIPSFFGSGVPE